MPIFMQFQMTVQGTQMHENTNLIFFKNLIWKIW